MGHYMDSVREVRHERCDSVHKGVRCDERPNHAGYHHGVDSYNDRRAWPQRRKLRKGQRVTLLGGASDWARIEWIGPNRGGAVTALIRWNESGHLDLFDQGRLVPAPRTNAARPAKGERK